MANVGSTSMTIDEAVSFVLADPGSDIDNFSLESESSESSDDDQPLATIAIPNKQRGKAPVRINTIQTREGSRAGLAAKKGNEAQTKELELEEKWKKEDNQPPIPHFTGISKINVDVPEDSDLNFFVDFFITEKLIDMIAGQTNLYAEQYRETNPNLPRNSRAGRCYNMTNREMKNFIVLLLLTGIIQKPKINHDWSNDPLLKSSSLNETMARNLY